MAKKVLFIGAVWPEPNSSAGGTRLMQLIDLFQENQYEVIYASAAAKSEFAEDLSLIGVTSSPILLNDSSFDVQIQEIQPQVVVFDRFMSEEQFGWRVKENCPNAIRIIETIDLHCLRKARQQHLKSGMAVNELLLNSEMAFREVAAVLRSDLSLMISSFEFELLRDFFRIDTQLLYYLPYRVPSLKFQQNFGFHERTNFVSIGNFKHEPNWDAVLYLKNEIWPLIRKKIPQAELHIYGAYPEEKVYQLHQEKEGFLIKGRAESAHEVMQKARVCLAPLRFGAGIKGKLTESMLCGTPNVTTPVGSEGMKGDLAWNGFVETSPTQFAESAVELYQNQALWEEKQRFGYQLLKENFNPDLQEKNFIQLIEKLSEQLIPHRSNNFLGAMLHHHQFQSSKYLSKWIELKNK